MREKLRLSITTYIHFLVDFTCAYWMFHMMMRQYCDYVECPVGETLADNSLVWPLIYNFCAFGLQLPIGWIVDRFAQKRPWRISSLGCLILAITGGLIFGERVLEKVLDGIYTNSLGSVIFCYSDQHIFCYAILLGIGNALFHVGAGVEILHLSAQGGRKTLRHRKGEIAAIDHMGYRMMPVGIFVSSGALGLFVGQVVARYLEMVSIVIYDYYEAMKVISLVMIGLMLVAAWLNALLTKPMNSYHRKADQDGIVSCSASMRDESAGLHETDQQGQTVGLVETDQQGQTVMLVETDQRDKAASCYPNWHMGIILLLFLVVVLRSFLGGVMEFSWYGWPEIALVLALCVTLGKVVGGILADRIGVLWTVVVPLSISAMLFWFASDYMIPGLMAVLLFQTTMPITLSLMHRQTPGHPGMAFALLSFGLFLGSLPKMGFGLWEQRQGMTAKRYRVIYFLRDCLEHIGSVVAAASLLLLLIVLFLWWRAWKGENGNGERKK